MRSFNYNCTLASTSKFYCHYCEIDVHRHTRISLVAIL